MANFDETRFLGLTPRAIGLTVVAVAIVIGLFFIPEAVKFLFDAKPKASREQVATTSASPSSKQGVARKAPDSGERAALSRERLSAINADAAGKKRSSEQPAETVRVAKKSADNSESSTGKGGIFSGWDFNVKANPSGGQKVDAPASLSFEKIVSKDGVNFLKQGRAAIPRFLKQEALVGGAADEAIDGLRREMNAIIAGDTKGASSQEVANRLRSAHVTALRGMRAAGADRGVMLRWLDLPVIRFIDTQGEVKAARKIRELFDPGLILMDLSVKQRPRRNFGANGRTPTSFKAEFSVIGSDVQKIVAYSNGKLVRSMKLTKPQLGEQRSVKIQGDATGVWTFVAYDSFGARPYSKSYSFYPKATIFRQERDGTFQIGFLPGSGRNSLDRFFLVGASGRRRSSDSSISTF